MMWSLCFILGFVHFVFANDNKEYVVEAEEDKTINITCKEPSVINVTAVMYGRDSKRFPCENENQSRIVVMEKCQYRSFCYLEVNDDNFKDICFGLLKERLKVKYRCVDAFKVSTTTIGATIGVLSSIIALLTITFLLRRYHRLQKDHKRKIETEKSSQSWLIMASDETNGNGLQNIYTDIDEERQRTQSYNDSPTYAERQLQQMYSKSKRGLSDDNTPTDALYSHTSVETYDALHKGAANDIGENTLMYDHIAT